MRPIYMEPEAAVWFAENQPWPPAVYRFLNEVDKHNQKVEALK